MDLATAQALFAAFHADAELDVASADGRRRR
jgi:hypothetical protein